MESDSHHFRKNFSNDNQKKENNMELDLFDHYYNFYTKKMMNIILIKYFLLLMNKMKMKKKTFFLFNFHFGILKKNKRKRFTIKEMKKIFFNGNKR